MLSLMCTFPAKLLCCLSILFVFHPARAQTEQPAGAAAVEQALGRLNVLGRVLMIAAHPHDDNNMVLAWAAGGRHFRTAYLSATRGEGGQNLIGPELGEELGLIRTQELLAARRVDGAVQFFTRAIDFGFSKSAAETLAAWGHQRILSDIVWVIRNYRPDVITMTFAGTPRDGHGHHQASGILAKEAYEAAGDPARFPEQLNRVQPWRAKRLVHHPYFAQPAPGAVVIEGGEFNPVLGRSYAEIAGLSRSMHRSQAMGSPQPKGPSARHFVVVAGEPARGDIFDGIDTGWSRLPGGAAIGVVLSRAAADFDPREPAKTIPALLRARPLIAAIRDPWAAIKLAELDEAVALCAGLWLDAEAERWAVTPGSALGVRLVAVNRSRFPLSLEGVDLSGMGSRASEDAGSAALEYNRVFSRQVSRPVPAAQPLSQPYWLVKPPSGEAYQVEEQALIGLPENPFLLDARFRVAASGQILELVRPVRHRYVDPVYGEQYRPVVVAPPAAINFPRGVLLFPAREPRKLPVEVAAQTDTDGDVRLATAPGWHAAPPSRPFRAAAGERHSLEFEITPPAAPGEGFARAPGAGMRVISYPHIPPQVWFPPAEARLVRADVRLAVKKIGYVMGAGDEVPEALRLLGAEVVLLAPADLARGSLQEFGAIVTGVRAYNVRPDLRANQQRLLDYVRNGGTMVVQYNVLDRSLEGVSLGPYPITLGRGRVSVEDAPVRLTAPASPLLAAPNAVAPRDFEGWVQERGLYFAAQWDPRYATVLESRDPGEQPMAGGLLWTRYGKGVYVFTAYSWFRQLPAGVPGAYRLFANLLSAK